MKRSLHLNQTQQLKDDRLKILKNPSIYPQILTLKPQYTIFPSIDSIINNNMTAKTLTISYKNASIFWGGLIDLKTLRLPLHCLITIGQDDVEVYPDTCSYLNENLIQMQYQGIPHNQTAALYKPPIGFQLNKQCIATFKLNKRINRKKLAQVCNLNNCELLEFEKLNNQGCQFKVQIPHFTKYVFKVIENDNQDLQEYGEVEKNQNQTKMGMQQMQVQGQLSNSIEQSLIGYFKSKFLQNTPNQDYNRIQEQQSKLTQAINKNLFYTPKTENFTRFYCNEPSDKRLSQIHKFNKSNQFYSYNPSFFKGFRSCLASNGSFITLRMNKGSQHIIHLGSPKTKSKNNLADIREVLKLHINQYEICDYILNETFPMKIRQQLALYAICFLHPKFHFVKFENKILIRKQLNFYKNKNSFTSSQLFELLKDCLEWIIQENQSNLQMPKNKYFLYLSRRKIPELCQELLKFGHYQEAEFVANIEDKLYRQSVKPRNLSQSLGKIANFRLLEIFQKSQPGEQFQNYSWILRFAMTIWYQYSSFSDREIKQIFENRQQKIDGFQAEFQILRIFYYTMQQKNAAISIENCSCLSWKDNSNVLIWQWFFSENCGKYYGTSKNQDLKTYKRYRYLILQKLVSVMMDSSDNFYDIFQLASQLLNFDTFLSQVSKQTLIETLAAKYTANMIKNLPQNQLIIKFEDLISNVENISIYGSNILISAVLQYIEHIFSENQKIDLTKSIDILSFTLTIYKIIYNKFKKCSHKKTMFRQPLVPIIKQVLSKHFVIMGLNFQNINKIVAILQQIQQIIKKNKTSQSLQDLKSFLSIYLNFLQLKVGNCLSGLNFQAVMELLSFHQYFHEQNIKAYILKIVYFGLLPEKQNSIILIKYSSAKAEEKKQKNAIHNKLIDLYGNNPSRKLKIILLNLKS